MSRSPRRATPSMRKTRRSYIPAEHSKNGGAYNNDDHNDYLLNRDILYAADLSSPTAADAGDYFYHEEGVVPAPMEEKIRVHMASSMPIHGNPSPVSRSDKVFYEKNRERSPKRNKERRVRSRSLPKYVIDEDKQITSQELYLNEPSAPLPHMSASKSVVSNSTKITSYRPPPAYNPDYCSTDKESVVTSSIKMTRDDKRENHRSSRKNKKQERKPPSSRQHINGRVSNHHSVSNHHNYKNDYRRSPKVPSRESGNGHNSDVQDVNGFELHGSSDHFSHTRYKDCNQELEISSISSIGDDDFHSPVDSIRRHDSSVPPPPPPSLPSLSQRQRIFHEQQRDRFRPSDSHTQPSYRQNMHINKSKKAHEDVQNYSRSVSLPNEQPTATIDNNEFKTAKEYIQEQLHPYPRSVSLPQEDLYSRSSHKSSHRRKVKAHQSKTTFDEVEVKDQKSVVSKNRSSSNHDYPYNIEINESKENQMSSSNNVSTSKNESSSGGSFTDLKEKIFGDSPTKKSSHHGDLPPRPIILREPSKYTVLQSKEGEWLLTIAINQKHTDKSFQKPDQTNLKAFSFSTEEEANAAGKAFSPPIMQSKNLERNSRCSLCQAKFAVLRRSHNCRNCGACVCSSCAVSWPCTMIPDTYNFKRENQMRICFSCEWSKESFRRALLDGKYDEVVDLYEKSNINLRCPFANTKGEVMYPIHCATKSGNLKLLKWLVDSNYCPLSVTEEIDDNISFIPITTSKRKNVLTIAMKFGFIDIIRYLVVEKNFNVTQTKNIEILQRALDMALRAMPNDYQLSPRKIVEEEVEDSEDSSIEENAMTSTSLNLSQHEELDVYKMQRLQS